MISNNTRLIPAKLSLFHICACVCAACDYVKVALTSVKRVTKMKAPAESGQASWSQISRTWLKHIATSTADELCFPCCTGSSCQKKKKRKSLITLDNSFFSMHYLNLSSHLQKGGSLSPCLFPLRYGFCHKICHE